MSKFSESKKRKIYEKTAGACGYCGRSLNQTKRTIDHIVPKHNGGDNSIENLIVACRRCNSQKQVMSTEGFKLWLTYQDLVSAYGFSPPQIKFLIESVGLREKFPRDMHVFYYEKLGLTTCNSPY